MKILHVVQGYPPVIGGTEFLIQQISERLVKRHGDEVTVFTTTAAKNCAVFWLPSEPTLPAGTEQLNGVTVRRFPIFNRLGGTRHKISKLADWAKLPYRDWLRAFFNGPLVWGLTQAITDFPAEVIGASSFPFLHMHNALAGGKSSHKPVILAGGLHPTDLWSFERPMIYQAIRQAEGYIAYTQFERDYLVNRGISPAKIHVIGAGVNTGQFAGANGQELRQTYGWADAPVIAYVGQLNRRKGVQHLLAAMPQVWATYPQARLLLAGAGSSFTDQLVQQTAELSTNFPDRVIILRDFAETEKAKIFAACDVFAFPSSEESFGIVFLEAWACRKPVIGMRAGAIPSLVEDEVNGLLVTPGQPEELAQAICRLLANPVQRTEMGQAGYEKMQQRYTWDKVTDKFREVYAEGVSR